MTTTTRKVPADVLDQAVALVNALAANQTFRDRIAEEEIGARVAAGELVPIDRLSLAPGLELVPAGRLAELEAAARVVVAAWLKLGPEQGWTEEEVQLARSVKGLAALFDFDAIDEDDELLEPEDEPVAEPEPDELPDAEGDTDEPATSDNIDSVPSTEGPKPIADVDTASETKTPGKPSGMPAKGDTGPCEECGADIVEPEQAQLSWILLRRKLCRDCHVGAVEPAAAPEPEAEEEPDAGPGDT